MNRRLLRNIHIFAAVSSIFCIATFWISSIIAELFFTHLGIATVKSSIYHTLLFFIPMMMITGITGIKLAGKSKNPFILKKKKRMPIIALIGVLFLLPCAILLHYWASIEQFDNTFYIVQSIEILMGAINLTLMLLSMRNGYQIKLAYKKY